MQRFSFCLFLFRLRLSESDLISCSMDDTWVRKTDFFLLEINFFWAQQLQMTWDFQKRRYANKPLCGWLLCAQVCCACPCLHFAICTHMKTEKALCSLIFKGGTASLSENPPLKNWNTQNYWLFPSPDHSLWVMWFKSWYCRKRSLVKTLVSTRYLVIIFLLLQTDF